MAIEIRQEQQGAVKILVLGGRLDTETSADVEIAVQDMLGAGERHFLFDLAGISYVSSAGLRVLLALAKQLDGGKGTLRLCSLSAPVAQVFDVAGFSKLFAIFRDRAAALASHPQAKPDAQLAKSAAALIGAGETTNTTSKNAADLARSAAKILGADASGEPGSASGDSKARPMTPVPAPARPRPAPTKAPTQPAGILAKLRGLFGGKR